MNAFKMIMTLLISGCIGYFTNYIAVKMLFRPRTEKHILGKKVPFTPGVIPKNQPRLAKALGRTVSEQLLTGDDLKAALCSDGTANAVAQRIADAVFGGKTAGEQLRSMLGEERCAAAGALVRERLTAIAVCKLRDADIGAVIISEGTGAVKEKLSGSMLAMFVTDELIADLAAPIGAKIDEYIDRNAEQLIDRAVGAELERLASSTPEELLPEAARGAVTEAAAAVFKSAAATGTDALLASVDIPALVEARVNAMSVEQVEELVMSIMKHELNTVIGLGGIIGVVIGLLNLLL